MSQAERRNILLVTLDQWRGDCLSALGHPCLKTPHLDRVAAEGTLFPRHFAQAAPCGPSRASLFTGLYQHNHRSVRNGVPLDDRHPNLARETRRAGYDPVLFGYTDTSLDPRLLAPGDPALATFEGVLPGFTPGVVLGHDLKPWLAALARRGYALPEEGRDIYRPRRRGAEDAGWGPSFAPAPYAVRDSETNFLIDAALDYLALRREQSWFVHLSFIRPHPPFVAPAPYHALYDPAAAPAPRRAADRAAEARQHPWLAQQLDRLYDGPLPIQEEMPMAALDDRGLAQLRATYYGMISEVDDALGRLFQGLADQGNWDETLVVVTSDHGEQLGDHWLWGKEGYFDQAFHVPLILRDPAASRHGHRGIAVEAFTESVDLMPTILAWIGRPAPANCDGHSLLPFLRGEHPRGWRREVHWEFDFRDLRGAGAEAALGLDPEECALAVIRDEQFKYVHFAALPPLLFDLARDPDELEDRAQDPAYLPVMLRYAQKLLSWRMTHEDRTLSHFHLGPGGVQDRRPGPTAPA